MGDNSFKEFHSLSFLKLNYFSWYGILPIFLNVQSECMISSLYLFGHRLFLVILFHCFWFKPCNVHNVHHSYKNYYTKNTCMHKMTSLYFQIRFDSLILSNLSVSCIIILIIEMPVRIDLIL